MKGKRMARAKRAESGPLRAPVIDADRPKIPVSSRLGTGRESSMFTIPTPKAVCYTYIVYGTDVRFSTYQHTDY